MSDKGASRSRSRSSSTHSRKGRYTRTHMDRSRSGSPRGGGGGGRSSAQNGGGRSRRYSRSRSRSPRRRRSSRYSRSPSPYFEGRRGGGGRYYGGGGRERSRSPMSRRRRHMGSRDAPTESKCLGVFGLSMYTQERELRDLFTRYGPVEDVQVVYDHQTGRSRGFAFVYMRNTDDAVEAKEMIAGSDLDGHKVRVDYSITERAHTPTPGVYLGRPTGRGFRGGGRGGGSRGGDDYYRRRSPSPYYRRSSRYSRSRSRSYSPRRY